MRLIDLSCRVDRRRGSCGRVWLRSESTTPGDDDEINLRIDIPIPRSSEEERDDVRTRRFIGLKPYH
jgi:hypothetical protein